jgi:hypothetical protein
LSRVRIRVAWQGLSGELKVDLKADRG